MSSVNRKRFTGKRVIKRKSRELVGDSYQADKENLDKLRKIGKQTGISKAELLRWATELVIAVYDNRKAGQETVTVTLMPKMRKEKE